MSGLDRSTGRFRRCRAGPGLFNEMPVEEPYYFAQMPTADQQADPERGSVECADLNSPTGEQLEALLQIMIPIGDPRPYQ